MLDDIARDEAIVRLTAFAAVFAVMAVWEALAPRRLLPIGRRVRWPGNLAIVVLNSALLRLVFPVALVSVALVVEASGWGLLAWVDLPRWMEIALAVLLLDLAIYGQHVLFHAVPMLWRVHRMHHADLGFDVTTGIRFHPIEMLLSKAIKIALIVALGAPAIAVLIFEVVLNATSMFNHGNVRLPVALDRRLRWLVVTPDMHRVHHSIRREETDSNFGFNLPWWDRLFRTYRAQPQDGHDAMTIGIAPFRTQRDLRLDRMLIQPFLSTDGPPAEPDPRRDRAGA